MHPIRALEFNNDFRVANIKFYAHISAFATLLKQRLEHPQDNNDDIRQLYNQYLQCFIEDYTQFAQLYWLSNGKRGSNSMHIFVELSRAHTVLMY